MSNKDPNEEYNKSRELMMKSRGKKADGSWDTPDGRSPQTTGSSCFPASALVRVPEGERAIAAVSRGDRVLAVDSCGRISHREVLRVHRYAPTNVMLITLQNSITLRVTASHSLYVDGSLRRAADARVGSRLRTLTAAGEVCEATVSAIAVESTSEEVFNLVVAGEFTFVVDGVVAHSFTHCRWLRMLLWRLLDAARSRIGGTTRARRASMVAGRLLFREHSAA